MIEDRDAFVQFLIEAKCAAYAGGGQHAQPWRPASHDLPYCRDPYFYVDTYLGGLAFVGEEAVWLDEQPLWGMNYYGRMLVEEVPAGFDHCLKSALRQAPPEAPYRGPAHFQDGALEYRCQWSGGLDFFSGSEQILLEGQPVYELVFHGGIVR